MNARQVADYLHMDRREVAKLASRGQIPCRKVRGEFVFNKGQVDHWVETQMPDLSGRRLAKIEKAVSIHHGFDDDSWRKQLVCPLIPRGGIAAPLDARTRDGAVRSLIALAEGAGLVYARDELLKQVRSREELCSTGILPGIAIPHPRHPLPYDIAGSFIVVGLTPSGVPYGASDGKLTRLFFLVCCKDERTHLHVLARLARMLEDCTACEQFMHADSPDQLREMLVRREEAILQGD